MALITNSSAHRLTRRRFLYAGGVVAASSLAGISRGATKARELTITGISVQQAKGRRLSPVAPNAYAPYRGYEVSETVLRIQTRQGFEGLGSLSGYTKHETLKRLIGRDVFALFQFGPNDRILGPAAEHEALFTELRGADIALVDLLGKALNRTAAALLGESARDTVQAYDGSVYMEDLLKAEEVNGLVYWQGANSDNPVERVARKAHWVVNERSEGFKAIKIKIGRSKWMRSPEEALARDIEVTHAVRQAVGPDVKLLVDGNLDYWGRARMTHDYATGVASSNLYFMEEMFPEDDFSGMRELKRRLRSSRNTVKLAAGESHPGGVVEAVYTQRFRRGEIDEPLVDIEQGDMNANGFMHLRRKAAIQAKLGMTMAPHNFASKLGFYAQVHLGMVTPNWEFSEVDDAQFPALVAEGVVVKNGFARLTGAPGLGVTLRPEHLEKPKAQF